MVVGLVEEALEGGLDSDIVGVVVGLVEGSLDGRLDGDWVVIRDGICSDKVFPE